MTESVERPDGAIPTPVDNPVDESASSSGGTMIGEPLPVGAYADASPEPEPRATPGLPKAPDQIDEALARAHQAIVDGRSRVDSQVRPDQATMIDAVDGRVVMSIRPIGVREALIMQIAEMAEREHRAVEVWAQAVRLREESRDEWERYGLARRDAEEALVAMGLDIEGDHAAVEPTAPVPIPDSQIV